MKYGVMAPQMGWNASAAACRDVAQAAEDLGYDSVWTADHVAMPATYESEYPFNEVGKFPVPGARPFYEVFTTLGYLSAVTQRVQLGISVCIVPYRHPSLLAKSIATVDQLSEGRFIFGAGVGWLAEEFDALGMSYRTRGKDTDEALRLLELALGEEQPVTFKGERYEIEDIYFAPGTWQGRHVPIWVGGVKPPALRRTGNAGDGWFPHMFGASPEMMRASMDTIASHAEAAGRPTPSTTALFIPLELVERTIDPDVPAWEKRLLSVSPDDLTQVLRQYEALGVDNVLFTMGGTTDSKLESMQRIAAEVFPAMAGLAVRR
ncbi:TIGR03619 family F420-dependent LLM class oxidoreductase [Salinibacterium sp. ZJ450]|uniref:TIGR03619 family F420-dependent LLM class oxidoreductase n=1 Tax=Salinibacterium sp. ZJ450 TaxID=2708338 RepID=UPI001420F657|nr:TIGR03619 family F420-dependent LLM class oxidoreductase [Salinibacterium sp. ZJ450]